LTSLLAYHYLKLTGYSVYCPEAAKMTRKSSKNEQRKSEIIEHCHPVITEEGPEVTSNVKIAKRMNIHPCLIIHYLNTKLDLTIELFDRLIERSAVLEYFQFGHIKEPQQRFNSLMETLFYF
jgi:hypothetical protein